MVFHYCILIAYYVFMIETFEYVDFFFDRFNELLTYGYLFHRDKAAVVEVDALIYFAICSLANLFDKLVALNGLVFGKIIHLSKITNNLLNLLKSK